jgi:hypothetical protein
LIRRPEPRIRPTSGLNRAILVHSREKSADPAWVRTPPSQLRVALDEGGTDPAELSTHGIGLDDIEGIAPAGKATGRRAADCALTRNRTRSLATFSSVTASSGSGRTRAELYKLKD